MRRTPRNGAPRTISCRQQDTDRYGRIVAICFEGDEDLGAWLVTTGLAVAWPKYSDRYVAAEAEARDAGRGLWQGEFDLPWEWRRRNR